MKQKEISILVFIYNSYKDPLFQNLLLTYIKTLSKKGNYRFDLITFEQEEYEMTISDILLEKELLKDWNILWHPKKFHTGKFLLAKKLYDVLSTLSTVIKIKLKYRTKYIFAFANVAAAMSILFSKFLNLKLVIYSYEPHSNFMVELGLWRKESLKYKILNYLEISAGKNAYNVMTGTKYGVALLKEINAQGKTYRLPTAVDSNDFIFKPAGRDKIRELYKVQNKDVFIYIGKLGDLYYREEIADLFSGIYLNNKNAHFIIVTTFNLNKITIWMNKQGIPNSNFSIARGITNEDVKNYISAADFGISAVPFTPSQKYRSPTKIAEYLLCGLPYITCKGISEDDVYAIKHSVGVVVNNFSVEEVNKNYQQINNLLGEDKEKQRERCRKVGLEYRSKEKIDNLLQSIFN